MRHFAFCQGDILLTDVGGVPPDISALGLRPWNRVTELAGATVWRLDNPITAPGWRMVPLRQAYHMLPPADYQLAGKCAELLYWDANSRYCGCCGAPTRWQTAISKQCEGCRKEWWPQLATAVIVRVTRGDEILMVKPRNLRGDYFGLVAGFVETGESLEQCVERELREEAGIAVSHIRYFGSQPWPYPCGLMVGFTAQYASGELTLQKAEIRDGGWYSRHALPPIPDQTSMARWLIDDWLSDE